MTEPANTPHTDAPSDAMRSLDRLIGTWNITGGATGSVTYEHLPGNHFLIQHVALQQHGQRINGIEIIGHLQPFGGERSEEIHSRFYDNHGSTFDYVYELDDDTLWIWAGERGSPAYYQGTFNPDDTTVTGSWTYPGGDGYDATMVRT